MTMSVAAPSINKARSDNCGRALRNARCMRGPSILLRMLTPRTMCIIGVTGRPARIADIVRKALTIVAGIPPRGIVFWVGTPHPHTDREKEEPRMPDSITGSCCSHNAVAVEGRKDLLARSADQCAECPVMVGSTVVKADAEAAGLFRDYNGERYYFCCAGCGPAFDADPTKYVTATA